MSSCGLDGCASPCHQLSTTSGRYCAPTRCYCGGCPGHVPVERSPGPVTVDQLVERRQLAVADARRQLAGAHLRHDLVERAADAGDTYVTAGGAGLVAA